MPLSDAAVKEINHLLDAQNDGDDPMMVSKKDRIMQLLAEGDETYVCPLHPKTVGIHPDNRDEDEMEAEGVHERGSKIVFAGFSRAIMEADTIAIEDDETKYIARKTIQTTSMSDKFAKLKMDQIRVGSLGSGHGTQFLNCVNDEVPCDLPNLSIDGKMSKSKLFKDKGLKDACEGCVNWVVIKSRNHNRFPRLARFIQSALNIKNHIAVGEGWTQMHSKIVAESKASAKKTGKVDYKAVERAVVRSNPPRVEDVSVTVDYIRKWGGGIEGSFVKSTNLFMKMCAPNNRHVSAGFFGWLSKLDIPLTGGGYACFMPFFVQALVKAHVIGDSVVEGTCRNISQAEVMSVTGKNKERCEQGAQYMKRGRELVQQHSGLTDRQRTTLLGFLDVHLVHVCLQKPHLPRDIDSMEKVNKQFVARLSEAAGIKTHETVEPDAEVQSTNIVEYDESGVMVGAQRMSLRNKGFDIEKTVLEPCKGVVHIQLFEIYDIAPNGDVTLAAIDKHGETDPIPRNHSVVKFAEFDGVYRLTNKSVKMHKGWPEGAPKDNIDYRNFALKSQVVSSLHCLGIEHHQSGLRIQDQPLRAVFFDDETNVGVGCLVIPPCTMQVAIEVNSRKVIGSKAVVCTVGTGEVRIILTHSFDDTFCSPYWSVRDVDKKDNANCHLIDYSIEVKVSKMSPSKCKPHTTFVCVPCLVNFKDVAHGEEVVLYKPAVEVEQKAKDKKHKLVLDSEKDVKVQKVR